MAKSPRKHLTGKILTLSTLGVSGISLSYCIAYIALMSIEKTHTKIMMSDYAMTMFLLFLGALVATAFFGAVGLFTFSLTPDLSSSQRSGFLIGFGAFSMVAFVVISIVMVFALAFAIMIFAYGSR